MGNGKSDIAPGGLGWRAKFAFSRNRSEVGERKLGERRLAARILARSCFAEPRATQRLFAGRPITAATNAPDTMSRGHGGASLGKRHALCTFGTKTPRSHAVVYKKQSECTSNNYSKALSNIRGPCHLSPIRLGALIRLSNSGEPC